MKNTEKKLKMILEKYQTSENQLDDMKELENIMELLESIETLADQHLNNKDFLKNLKKLNLGPLLEKLKAVYKPAFEVEENIDIKEKILEWLLLGETDKHSSSLENIFQEYLKKCEFS